MSEEIVYRGLMFCAFYGVATAAPFPLAGKAARVGLIVGTIGSCFVFAAGHEQYSIALRVVVGLVAVAGYHRRGGYDGSQPVRTESNSGTHPCL